MTILGLLCGAFIVIDYIDVESLSAVQAVICWMIVFFETFAGGE